MPTLRELGEREAIRRLIASRSRGPGTTDGSGVVLGGGDDAAVLRPRAGADLVATTDTFVEGRHYLPAHEAEIFPPRTIGARLARANLSDLAAMAARPRWALHSLGVRAEHEIEDLIELEAGLGEALAADGAELVGGNLVGVEGPEWMSLALFGEAPPGQVWTRAGARPGDLIAITGFPGRAVAGVLIGVRSGRGIDPEWQPLLDAWIRPISRVGLALALAPLMAVTAAIDISDGLIGDLTQICRASGVGAEVDGTAWPDDPLITRAAAKLGVHESTFVYGPSDDYELLLAIAPERRAECEEVAGRQGVPMRIVGKVIEGGAEVVLSDGQGEKHPLVGDGYDHFR